MLDIHRLADRLSASMPWLDQVAASLSATFDPIFGQHGSQPVKDALYGIWMDHPLHPTMTDLPIGFWTSSAILDLAGMERGADLTLKAGTVSALGAALTGVAQWQDLQEEEAPRRLGALHAALNITATGLYGLSWIARDRDARGMGIALSTTGYGMVIASSWLGGDLAFRLGVGVNRIAFEQPADDWTDVRALDDLADTTLTRIELDGGPIVLYRTGNTISAISAACTHVGGPLDEGTVEDGCVTCPWHGSAFDLRDGTVVHGPATFNARAYDVRVEAGRVQVRPQAA